MIRISLALFALSLVLKPSPLSPLPALAEPAQVACCSSAGCSDCSAIEEQAGEERPQAKGCCTFVELSYDPVAGQQGYYTRHECAENETVGDGCPGEWDAEAVVR